MNLHFIKYFVTLSTTKNFTKAAKEVHVVQSTFSSGIKKLEQHLGVKLFERNNRSVKLTQHGEDFLPKAKKMIHQWYEIEEDFNIRNIESLKLGFVQNVSINDVLHFVNDYKKKNPVLHINIIEEKHDALLDALQRNKIDAFFTEKDIDEVMFEKMTVATEKLYFLIHCDHPLSNQSGISLKQLQEEVFIERSQCALYTDVFNELKQRKISLNINFVADNNETVFALVASGMGVTLMPKPVFSIPEVKFIPIIDANFTRKISLVWEKNYQHRELNEFIRLIKNTIASIA
ncbi:LysR family transcriptional regulator [Aquimarina aquimarini]|uniref:LysR family transcriptional regulator n=1 Tax=Aquimarina aquimarini TaxID=1191734 RepID=UPI000D54E36A|nr:LysR family transcriptional regulator [Aquimarina aquimarini]